MKIIWLTSKIFSFRRRENSKEVILEIEKIGDEGECEKRGVQTMLSVSPVEDALTIKQRKFPTLAPLASAVTLKYFVSRKSSKAICAVVSFVKTFLSFVYFSFPRHFSLLPIISFSAHSRAQKVKSMGKRETKRKNFIIIKHTTYYFPNANRELYGNKKFRQQFPIINSLSICWLRIIVLEQLWIIHFQNCTNITWVSFHLTLKINYKVCKVCFA